MDNIVMFIRKLAVYVMQLLHIKTQKVNLLDDDDDDDISCRPLLWMTNDVINGADKLVLIVIMSIPVRPQL